jgi:putative tryptophan/tyrosine transport system substrate-binding protein
MDRRRFLLTSLAGALAAPLAAEAQQHAKVAKVGVLWGREPTRAQPEAFEQGLRDRGWVKGLNVRIDYRFAEGILERLPALAAELVGLKVDVIVAVAAPETSAARQATRTIPIVFVVHGDPVGSGDVATLARPGGNVTGLAQMAPELSTKQLEILRQVVPRVARVAVIWKAANPTKVSDWHEVKAAAQTLGITLQSREVRRSTDFTEMFAAIRRERPDALLTLVDPVTVTMRASIVEFAAKEHLPAVYPLQIFVDSGGLISYGADLTDLFRRAPRYVDQILKGAKPADLSVEQARKFDLVINLKTAKALGLTIPPSLLLRADQVIE